VPVTPPEQIESTHQSFDAAPSFVHIHVRKPDETPASDRILFCSGARGRAQTLSLDDHSIFDWRSPTGAAARGSALYLKPDMASLSTGSVNFPTHVHEIAPLVDGLATQMRKLSVLPAIEIFDPTSTVHEGLWTADSSMSVCMYSSSWV